MSSAIRPRTIYDEDKILMQPFNHFRWTPPKNLFPANVWFALNGWFKVPKSKMDEIAVIAAELLYSTCLMDDLEDESKARQAIPTAHLVYGTPLTIVSTIYGTASVLQKLIEYQKPELIDDFIAGGLKVMKGQGMEIYFRHNLVCPTEEEYTETVLGKTSGTFMLSLKLLQPFAIDHATTDFEKFMQKLGLFIQVCNDYMSLKSTAYTNVKIFAEDITEGKFSHPVIHAIRNHPYNHEIFDTLKQRTSDDNLKKRFIDLLQKYGSLDYSWKSMILLRNECLEEMEKIGRNPQMEAVLNAAFDMEKNLM